MESLKGKDLYNGYGYIGTVYDFMKNSTGSIIGINVWRKDLGVYDTISVQETQRNYGYPCPNPTWIN